MRSFFRRSLHRLLSLGLWAALSCGGDRASREMTLHNAIPGTSETASTASANQAPVAETPEYPIAADPDCHAGAPCAVEDGAAADKAEPCADATGDSCHAARAEQGNKLGRFQFTYYWMAKERHRRRRGSVVLRSRSCEPIARVSRQFAAQLAMEGTGRLRNGRVINRAGNCRCKSSVCYSLLSRRSRWGVGVKRRPLAPFRSVAVDPKHVAIGTKLYIPELDGLTMPGRGPWGGFVHDGCVVADDRGGNVKGHQLDFFTARRNYFVALMRRHRIRHVTVFAGAPRCDGPRETVVAQRRDAS